MEVGHVHASTAVKEGLKGWREVASIVCCWSNAVIDVGPEPSRSAISSTGSRRVTYTGSLLPSPIPKADYAVPYASFLCVRCRLRQMQRGLPSSRCGLALSNYDKPLDGLNCVPPPVALLPLRPPFAW